MKRIILTLYLLSFCSILYAVEPTTPYLGNDPRPCNVTISSTACTQLMTTQADYIGDWLLINHGDYSIYLSTYSIAFSSNATNASNVMLLKTDESINLNGRTTKNIYAITADGSASNRLDMFYVTQK